MQATFTRDVASMFQSVFLYTSLITVFPSLLSSLSDARTTNFLVPQVGGNNIALLAARLFNVAHLTAVLIIIPLLSARWLATDKCCK